jgi:hypothetical protein
VQPLASWEHVEGEVPDIAALARSRIDAYGLALLGTLRAQWVDPRRGATAAAQNVRATGPAVGDTRDRVALPALGDTPTLEDRAACFSWQNERRAGNRRDLFEEPLVVMATTARA